MITAEILTEMDAATKDQKAPKMMRAVLYEPGGPEKMSIGSVKIPDLKENEVLIKVYASAINRADTLQRQGKYPPPPGASEILGLEVAGRIEKLGPGCKRWQEQDKVMALLAGGGYAEYVAVHEDLVMPVPKRFTMSEAASIPETWLTAYQILHFVGSLGREDNVLIHAAGSGVGLAAIQLAKFHSDGVTVYVTAGTKSKLDSALTFGAKKGFNYKDGPFSKDVLQVTEGRGINLILDCVGGSFADQNAEVLSLDGRWVLYGLLGGANINGEFLSTILRKRIHLEGTTLRTRSLMYKSKLVQEFTEKILPNFENGTLKPAIDSEFPMGRISEAHSFMEENKNTGKIVLLIRSPDEHYE